MRIALDTNILAYAEGVDGPQRKTQALRLLEQLPVGGVSLPVQTLGELFQLLLRRLSHTPTQARTAILAWRDAYALIETSEDVLFAAVELAVAHRFSIWDGIVLGAAREGGCRLLLSEDLQEGFTWNGVTVANPFAASPNPLLTDFLG